MPNVACRRFSFLISPSTFSFFGGGGGGRGPPGGAGRMGKVVILKVAALALDGPLESLCRSWTFIFVNLGTEFVVWTRGGRPGCLALPLEVLVGERVLPIMLMT
jgi:hypothetical protein